MEPARRVTTDDPAGLRPVALGDDEPLCETTCVPPLTVRPAASRSNFRNGVVQDDPLPGVVRGRDYVTGVTPGSNSGLTRLGW